MEKKNTFLLHLSILFLSHHSFVMLGEPNACSVNHFQDLPFLASNYFISIFIFILRSSFFSRALCTIKLYWRSQINRREAKKNEDLILGVIKFTVFTHAFRATQDANRTNRFVIEEKIAFSTLFFCTSFFFVVSIR